MGSAKAATNTSQCAALIRRLLVFAIRRRAAIITVGLLAACSYGGFRVWKRLEKVVLAQPAYSLDPHQIVITPTPGWIRADVKTEALRDGSLDGAPSIIDEQLVERLAVAFAIHPWVARVERVAKNYPGRVVIDLVYRRPAGMVEVPGGLFPVDEAGVLLPSADFSTADAWEYPRITGIETQPLGPVGSPWGDRDVTGAAKIATALREVWRNLRLHSIRRGARHSNQGAHIPAQFELVTQEGNIIPWGHAPGDETAGEMPVAEKIAGLKERIANARPPDETARRADLDERE